MKINRNFLVICILVLLFSAPYQAYSFDVLGARVRPFVNIAGVYDDNINYSPDTADSQALDDYYTSLNFGLFALREGKTSRFDASVSLNYQFYKENTGFDSDAQYLTLNYYRDMSKYANLSLYDYFYHSDEPSDFAEEIRRTGGRAEIYNNTFQGIFRKFITKQFSYAVTYKNQYVDYIDDVKSDNIYHEAELEAAYHQTSAIIYFLSLRFRNRDYDSDVNATGYNVIGGIRKYFTKQLYWDASVGGSFGETFDGDSYSEPYFYTSITDEINENTNIVAAIKRETNSFAYQEDIFDYAEISGTLQRKLSQRFKGELKAYYGEGDFVEVAVTNKLLGVKADLAYELREDMVLALNYTFTDKKSTDETREYTKNKIFLELRTIF